MTLRFRLAERDVDVRLTLSLTAGRRRLSPEVDASDGRHRGPGHGPGLPLQLIRQSVPPALLQLWSHHR